MWALPFILVHGQQQRIGSYGGYVVGQLQRQIARRSDRLPRITPAAYQLAVVSVDPEANQVQLEPDALFYWMHNSHAFTLDGYRSLKLHTQKP
jgi:hypothetical protein